MKKSLHGALRLVETYEPNHKVFMELITKMLHKEITGIFCGLQMLLIMVSIAHV